MMKKRMVLFLGLAFLFQGCATTPNPHLVSTLPPKTSSFLVTDHIIKSGETLYRIAKSHHLEVSELMRANHIESPSRLVVGQRLLIPQAIPPFSYRPYVPVRLDEIKRLVGPRNPESVWKTITLHHSGTFRGNARLFDRDHHRRKMGGLFYHFVIGNGTCSSDGFIEVGWRWKKQVKANRPYDIQICLVGNFDLQNVSEAQFQTVIQLIHVLCQEYGIPVSHIRRHLDINGKNTRCPGERFPFHRLVTEISRLPASD